MSLDIRLNEKHDIDFTDNSIRLVDGARQVGQQIEILLKTFLGEWFMDTSHGIPYLESIMVKSPNRTKIESILRAKINAISLVTSIKNMDLQINPALRSLIVSADVETTMGLTTVKVGI